MPGAALFNNFKIVVEKSTVHPPARNNPSAQWDACLSFLYRDPESLQLRP